MSNRKRTHLFLTNVLSVILLPFQDKQILCGELKALNDVSQAEFCVSFSERNINFQKSVIFLFWLFILFNLPSELIVILGPQSVPELGASVVWVDTSLFPWRRKYKMQSNICYWTEWVNSSLANIRIRWIISEVVRTKHKMENVDVHPQRVTNLISPSKSVA